ncbi:cytochrome-c peroxidase [Riemerella columbipharyngis]|uniref:Cytochrome c peroxidase n=1 Tax=Riemerella columbipharyngis TaxID=1071918 RepID=A0A1G7D886_9FLAO|nr:cytochrome c peroxidase [Riemerella columbipharyngis]SDE47719.1 cytochrome c peroxidase [Riemerella columbipharyngis]
MKKNILGVVLLFFVLLSCRKEEKVYYPVDTKIQLGIPDYFPKIQHDIEKNYPTKYGIELGKKLFHEGRLSADGIVSCGFCHIQENAFTHHGHPVSHGVYDRIGIRNAPPVQNMIFLNKYMWDGSITNLEEQPLVPISTHEEMDGDIGTILKTLNNDKDYKRLFKIVYGDETATPERIFKALTQFMATLISADSKYDKVMRHEAEFSAQEQEGYKLFNEKCTSCHSTALFTDQSFRYTGLPYNAYYKDNGRERVTDKKEDYLKFRVPSLRNLGYTAPYMHDGRFFTLKAVLDFYSNDNGHQIQDAPNLDPLLKKIPGRVGIPMTEQEKKDIIAFLLTLDDPQFISNPAFAE